jgi:predicted MFS family arabinose efflux permease
MRETLRNRDFALLWSAGMISLAGDYALTIAVMIHVYRVSDSTLATAGVFAARLVPGVLVGSFAGVFVDRWDRKRTLVYADLSRGLLLLPMAIPAVSDRLWTVFVASAALGAIGQFFRPAESALLPNLVDPERLATANSLNALNDNLGRLAGPAIGAALYAAIGFSGAAAIDGATFLVSASLISMIRTDGRPASLTGITVTGSRIGRVVSEWRAGLRIVLHNRTLKVLFFVGFVANVSEGFFITLGLAPLVLDVLGGSEAQVGWIASAQAVGGIIAGLVVASGTHRITQRWLFGGGRAALGLSDLVMFNARQFAGAGNPAVGLAMGSMFVAGFPAVATMAGGQTLMQLHTEDAYRGRVFGAARAVDSVAVLVGLAIAGTLGERIGIVPVLNAGSVVGIAAGILAIALLPREDARRPLPNS